MVINVHFHCVERSSLIHCQQMFDLVVDSLLNKVQLHISMLQSSTFFVPKH